jgi:hypothetical protein
MEPGDFAMLTESLHYFIVHLICSAHFFSRNSGNVKSQTEDC